MTSVTSLERNCGSWVVSSDNGRKVFETFCRATAEKASAAGWKVESAAQYLGRINSGSEWRRAGVWK